MRRIDREVKDYQDVIDILNRCDVIRLGLNTPSYPYVVPMNFGVDVERDSLTLWFHCAPEGLKLDLVRENHRVGFEADCSHNLVTDDKTCCCTMEYESIIGYGDISICDDNESKLRALKTICCHYMPEQEFNFSESQLSAVCVLRLDVAQITGKRLKNIIK